MLVFLEILYLHLRGENVIKPESAPKTWRITSTYVEKTFASLPHSAFCRDHLHLRGENQAKNEEQFDS